jgi:predicted GIY-YIG superfamily endonuclease
MVSSPHVVYVLESISEPARHYTGLSSNAVDRLAWHNAGLSTYTAKNRPWRMLVSIEFADAASALRFEKYLKTGSGRAFAKRHFGAG